MPVNIERIKRAHQHFFANHARMLDEKLNDQNVTQLVQRYASQHGGFVSRSGNLVRKTHANVSRIGRGNRRIKIRNSAKYAAAQDGGSGLHGPKRARYPITPKREGGYLRFHIGSQLIFTRKVMHPGVKPTRFLYNATDAAGRQTAKWLRTGMHQVAKKF